MKRAKESATQKYDELVAEHGKLKERYLFLYHTLAFYQLTCLVREIRTNTELDKMMKEFKNKESENGRLTALLAKRDQEVHVLKQKVDDLEDTIGDQEVEHDEMVAKLAQSLDVLAKRKPRTAKRPAKPAAPINIDSLDEHFQNASLSGI